MKASFRPGSIVKATDCSLAVLGYRFVARSCVIGNNHVGRSVPHRCCFTWGQPFVRPSNQRPPAFRSRPFHSEPSRLTLARRTGKAMLSQNLSFSRPRDPSPPSVRALCFIACKANSPVAAGFADIRADAVEVVEYPKIVRNKGWTSAPCESLLARNLHRTCLNS